MIARKYMRITAIGLAILVIAGAMAGCKSEEQIQQQQVLSQEKEAVYVDLRSSVTVSGQGKVLLTPDTAKVYFSVRTQHEEATQAQQANAEAAGLLMAALEEAGVAPGDINTGSVNVNEQYNYRKTPPEVLGYEANCEMTVTVRDLDKLGGIITAAVAAGATDVRGPEYSIGNASAAYLSALEEAMADAQAKADVLAAAAGVDLAAVTISVEEVSTNQNVAPMAAARADVTAVASADSLMDAPIAVSDMEVTARISVVFEIR